MVGAGSSKILNALQNQKVKTRPPHQLTTARKSVWKMSIENNTNRSISSPIDLYHHGIFERFGAMLMGRLFACGAGGFLFEIDRFAFC
jgi:hypothetical protein